MFQLNKENVLNWIIGLSLLMMPITALILDEVYYVNLASRITILALAGVGLNLALGYGGLVSFGHAAFFGLGGYVAGISAHHAFEGTNFLSAIIEIQGSDQMLLIWLVTILLCAFLALIIGLISLRTEGVYFIMITLAFAQMIYYFAVSWPTYGGEDGLSIYVRNQLPWIDTYDAMTFFLVCFVLLIGGIYTTSRITGSVFGSALQTSRMNAVRLSTASIEPLGIRITAFVISAVITGLAGALYADRIGFVDPSMLSWHRSGEIMIFVILGGVGRLWGPVAGAVLFVCLEVFIGGVTERWQLFLGLVLLAVVLFAKGGLIGLVAGKARHV